MDALVKSGTMTVPLHQLIEDDSNVRKTGKDPSPALIASLREYGVIVPLIVREEKRGFLVVDGGKRLRALRLIHHGDNRTVEVPARIIEAGPADARELSLTAAIVREDLHPVDRYEAFAQLANDGAQPADLERTFAMTTVEVRQVLALGALSPTIRAAWRDDEIDANTAKRFTLAKDHKHQDEVFRRLKKAHGRVGDWQVRDALSPRGEEDDVGLLAFVGTDAYREAGGDLIEDLFGDRHFGRRDVVGDPKLLRKLAEAKLEEARLALIAAGWSWAEVDPTGRVHFGAARLPRREPAYSKEEKAERKRLEKELDAAERADSGDIDDGEDQRARLEQITAAAEARSYTPEEMAKAGCLLTIGVEGLDIVYGVLKGKAPAGTRVDPVTGQAKPAKKPAGFISDALATRLSEQLTIAASKALMADKRLALAVLVAGFEAGDQRVGVQLHLMPSSSAGAGPYATYRPPSRGAAFDSALGQLDDLAVDNLIEALSGVAAKALNFRVFKGSSPAPREKVVKAIIERLPPAAFNAALRLDFNREDYFASVSATVALAALKEMGVDMPASARKPALAAAGVAAAKQSGWLPKELRTEHYPGHDPVRAGVGAAAAAANPPGKPAGKPKGAPKAPAGGKAPAKVKGRASAAPAKRARAK